MSELLESEHFQCCAVGRSSVRLRMLSNGGSLDKVFEHLRHLADIHAEIKDMLASGGAA